MKSSIFFCSAIVFTLSAAGQVMDQLPGMPPVLDRRDIYAADAAGDLSPVVRKFPSLVYVPNSGSNSVDVIDPATYRIIRHFRVGRQPQHVTPSYDLKTLWVLCDLGDSLTLIDPSTGKKGKTIKVKDPYNMYYTPDGKYAIVVAERIHQLDFRDAQTMRLVKSVPVPCRGVDHMDFSADGRYLIASCEFSAAVVKVDVETQSVVGTLDLPGGGMPQDVKLSPDGEVFYVADMHANGVHLIDGGRMRILGFVPTGRGAHGLYASRGGCLRQRLAQRFRFPAQPRSGRAHQLFVRRRSRDSKLLYVSNRAEGSISVIDFASRKVAYNWEIPHGTPDMGGVSADGRVLWLSGRYSKEVYAIDTGDGHLLARIRVGKGPHGLCVYPQPGRYSLGHTGVFR